MINPKDVSVNNDHQLTSDGSFSYAGYENPDLVDLFYALKFRISFLNVSRRSSGSGLDSSGDEGDSPISKTAIRDTYLSCTEFNLGLFLFDITTWENLFFI